MIKRTMYFYDKKQANVISKLNDKLHRQRGIRIKDAGGNVNMGKLKQLESHCKYIATTRKAFEERVKNKPTIAIGKKAVEDMHAIVDFLQNQDIYYNSIYKPNIGVFMGLGSAISRIVYNESEWLEYFYDFAEKMNDAIANFDAYYKRLLGIRDFRILCERDARINALYKSIGAIVSRAKREVEKNIKLAEKRRGLEKYFKTYIVPILQEAKTQGWSKEAWNMMGKYGTFSHTVGAFDIPSAESMYKSIYGI